MRARPDVFLVNLRPHAFRAAFQRACVACGFTDCRFKPYSLRRGGATHLFITKSYSQVCQAGRWSAERTVRIYIQDSLAVLSDMQMQFSRKQLAFSKVWVDLLHSLEPPRVRKYGGRGRGHG